MEKSSRPAHLESAVSSLITELQEMAVTPHVRELRAKAVTYGRVIANWATYPPTAPQIQAMLECVTELEEKVSSARRSDVSHVGKKPQARRAEPPPLPSVPPDGVAWNAAVEGTGTGTRPRSRSSEGKTMPPPGASTRPPPAQRQTSRPPAGSSPPVSSPRSIDTPTPALLQSRRTR